MRNRTIAGLAAGALISGVLTAPLMVTTAHAAVSPISASDVTASALAAPLEVNAYGKTLGYDPAFELSQMDQALTLKQAAFPAFAGPPVFVTVSKVVANAVFDINGTEVSATGASGRGFVTGPLANGFAVPDLKLDAPFGTPAGDIELKSYELVLTVNDSPTTLSFTVVSPVKTDIAAVSDPAMVAKYSTFALGVGDGFEVTQADTALSLGMADFPAIPGIPAFVTVSGVELNAVFTLNGKEIPFSGSTVVEPAAPMANGFAFPTLTGTLPAGVKAGQLHLKDVSAVVTAMGSPTDIEIDVRRDVTVDFAATKAVAVVKVAPRLTKVKASYAKKKKALTVKANVAGSKGAATGKVKITIKKGKKTVRTITVKLNKKGAFSKKIKKIKGKGKFKVVIQYQGDKNYKTAKVTKQFKA